jgi:amino acid transporter
MKSLTLYLILTVSTTLAFITSYFLELTMDNINQYLAVALVIFADGFFGILAGIKREGFRTYKAIKILKSLIFWVVALTVVLSIEKGFPGTEWLSETLITPFLVFQLISILKNASMAGFIKNELVNIILDKIDKHKGIRTEGEHIDGVQRGIPEPEVVEPEEDRPRRGRARKEKD